ncbi:MAG: hypothetical protein EOP09_20075, partial [Proteobacteria bacterium]
PCNVLPKSGGKPTRAYQAYGSEKISERHRHRFEFSNRFRAEIEEKGLLVSGAFKDAKTGIDLVEMVEIPGHPWFLGCQFHPEFLSRPLSPHPLFSAFIKASKEASQLAQRSLPGMKSEKASSGATAKSTQAKKLSAAVKKATASTKKSSSRQLTSYSLLRPS